MRYKDWKDVIYNSWLVEHVKNIENSILHSFFEYERDVVKEYATAKGLLEKAAECDPRAGGRNLI